MVSYIRTHNIPAKYTGRIGEYMLIRPPDAANPTIDPHVKQDPFSH